MRYEILGETIKSATSIKIGEIFKIATNQTDNQGNIIYTYPKRYKENITKQQYPNFHIIQAGVNITHVGRKRLQLDYTINIQYRVAENTESVTNLQQQLDAIGLKLCSELTELDLELPTKTKNRYYEKVDGVCQMFFNITVYATPEETTEIKMQTLDLNENLHIKEE